ncbi:hypothetical protein J4558_23270 [Leptolyngbya sp. 15MV]|nr:hypothetical protein J4558_23270 [Leptolyngbya sp. 15MV]
MKEKEFLEIYQDLIESKNFDSALTICEQFISDNPESFEGYRKRAYLYSRSNEFENAISDISEAIRLNPMNSTYYFFRGWWKIESGDFVGGETDVTVAIDLDRDSNLLSDTAYFFRSLARVELGRNEDAIADLRNVESDFMIHLKRFGKISREELLKRATKCAD